MNATENRPAPLAPRTHEELRERRSRGLQNLEDALNEAYAEAGVTAPEPPTTRREWKHSVKNQTLEWKHTSFGGIQIEVQGFSFTNVDEHDLCTIAQITCGQKEPTWLSFGFAYTLNPHVRLLHAQGGEVTPINGHVPPFRVQVEWNGALGHHFPHTRQKDKDNFDLVFLRPDGADSAFAQIQVSLTSRGGRFFVAIQEIYCGQVGRTTKAKAEELAVTTHPVGSFAGVVIPLYPENAFPGADYLKTFPRMGPKVIEFAMKHEAAQPLSKCVLARWNPPLPTTLALPEKMTQKGWKTASVLWFNLVIGWGFALCEDGKACFVHFSNIIDADGRTVMSKGEFPMLQPMTGVALKYKDESDGKRKATAIRVL